ncbi:30S ribosomal protein S6 [Buchnera aphidicola str. Bp (Baizongia pistaciae)]|uniref:Small ribosomal subunit protein bS6 n=1 Tax=Buchnera aphidicola subsp. Baizongia pistaciae (strain Bp) TaxID=224915 RepID=RS6_BUCBP|nr:30S ribosomal protein S6 [Buchnera aphidicola]Q89A41.1 RecName: Full=Small ribosomal subunit protein bS6; AltName: Full=30S ribosomal protein S6 [Buchnera aphidicola str. Bp (Baizongia pistaciae)]AAO27213.1 30S ribosomal protein S6 [Buchnera aphidicola str. Bp (Baizongia pistaciae)]
MRHYEIILLIHPDCSEKLPIMIEKFKKLVIGYKGRIHRLEDWGRRQLAYSINKLHKAHYFLMNIEVPSNCIQDLSNTFRYDDLVIRNIIMHVKKSVTEISPMLKSKEDKLDKKDRVVVS